jgi:dTDP-4-amino-4,6-dideoxygalactose transaminase
MKIVSNQLSPNFTFQESISVALQLFRKKPVEKEYFEHIFSTNNYILLNVARTGLGLIAEELKKKKETRKIGIPAFCCAVMATPFLTQGFEIEWIDIDEKGIMDQKDFEKKSKNICCVIVPHTFGMEAPIKELSKIAKENDMWVVEDCAHKFVSPSPSGRGARGEGQFFQLHSFGREKDVSCVSGGALIHLVGAQNFEPLQDSDFSWTIHHLLQPLIYSISIPWWHAGGKAIPAFFAKIGFLPKAVTYSEKHGKEDFPKDGLAAPFQGVLKKQIKELNKNIEHRKKIASAWKRVLAKKFPDAQIIIPENYFRVIVIGIEREKILKELSNSRTLKLFHLTEWDGSPIAPAGVDLKKFGYKPGQCPNAEKFTESYITFPTNKRVSLKDVQYFDRMFRA